MFTQSSLNKKVTLKNNIQLWVEAFGKREDPAILLMIGAGAQCLLWPEEFCKKLAGKGYFVMRYDHRDTGLSSAINYQEAPYTIMDMTKDALGVIDSFKIEAAHIVGFSMGGQIAQFIGAYFPERAQSLTLMATSTSFEEGFNAFEGKETPGGLSPPKDYYVKWATRSVNVEQQSHVEKVQDFLASWKLLNGEDVAFDEDLYKKIAHETYTRSELHNPHVNHALAMKSSYEEHKKAPGLITLPTLIVHGTNDPVFGMDHAEALHEQIQGSRLIFVDKMGHNLNTHFFDALISHIEKHIQLTLGSKKTFECR